VGAGMIDQVLETPLKIIDTTGGCVMHAMKCSDEGFSGFGEAYFSTVQSGSVKAWKRHKDMTLNIVVPVGSIRFVIYNEQQFKEVIISRKNYIRLTVPPMLWFGFQAVGDETAILMNVASIEHDPDEVERKDIESFDFDWSIKR
jgi:dTDP-4-dehydrorhamnose 3,5-epimerase